MGEQKKVTAKEYLERYEKYGRDIKRAMTLKGDPHSGISEQETDKALAELKLKRRKIITSIDTLGRKRKIYGDILYKKYIEGKQLKKIAAEIDRSYDYVRHKYRDAMRAIEKNLNEE